MLTADSPLRSRLVLVAALVILPTSAAAATIELTAPGDEICCDVSDYSIRGYRFTVVEPFTAYGVEWQATLPAGASIAARVFDGAGNLLLAGEPTVGDGSEQWYRAAFTAEFEAGQTYDVLVYNDAPDEVLFRRTNGNCCDYPIPPYLTAVESRSNKSHEDEPSTTYNTWPAYMRLVLDAPDSDGDGVVDSADACPDSPPGDPVEADGCPPPPATTGETASDTSTPTTSDASGASDDGPDDTGGGPGDTGDTGDTGNGSAATSGASTGPGAEPAAGEAGCGCRTSVSPPSWLLLTGLAGLGVRRRRR